MNQDCWTGLVSRSYTFTLFWRKKHLRPFEIDESRRPDNRWLLLVSHYRRFPVYTGFYKEVDYKLLPYPTSLPFSNNRKIMRRDFHCLLEWLMTEKFGSECYNSIPSHRLSKVNLIDVILHVSKKISKNTHSLVNCSKLSYQDQTLGPWK